MQWYALTARDPADAARRLRRDGYTAYCPHERITRRRGRKAEDIERPLWMGYFFARCEDYQLGAALVIADANDFIRYTDPNGARMPLRLPDDALVSVVLAEAYGVFNHTRPGIDERYRPAPGDKVRIVSSLWKEHLGKVLTTTRHKAKVQLAAGGTVTVSADALEAA